MRPSHSRRTARTQLLTLERTVKLTDYDPVSPDERNKTLILTNYCQQTFRAKDNQIQIHNQGRGMQSMVSIDEVTYDEWDQVRVDSQGVASFYINVALREWDGGDERMPLISRCTRGYYTIPDEEGAEPAILMITRTTAPILECGPFLSVSPGETKTRRLNLKTRWTHPNHLQPDQSHLTDSPKRQLETTNYFPTSATTAKQPPPEVISASKTVTAGSQTDRPIDATNRKCCSQTAG